MPRAEHVVLHDFERSGTADPVGNDPVDLAHDVDRVATGSEWHRGDHASNLSATRKVAELLPADAIRQEEHWFSERPFNGETRQHVGQLACRLVEERELSVVPRSRSATWAGNTDARETKPSVPLAVLAFTKTGLALVAHHLDVLPENAFDRTIGDHVPAVEQDSSPAE